MDNIEAFQQVVRAAIQDKQPVSIVGGGTKSFYGRGIMGDPLLISGYQGIIEYQPTELVITAKAGTALEQINQVLAENNQRLGFEAPDYGSESTLGGVIAAGLCGSSRPYSGGIQDYVLGIKLLSGTGEVLNFGGKVIKNVAGFDLSRLMVGAMGCLGIILEVSMKVVPVAESEKTICLEQNGLDDAVSTMNNLAGQPVPVTASAWCEDRTWIRLSGSERGVDSAFGKIQKQLGGENSEIDQVNNDKDMWKSLSNATHPFFAQEKKYIVSVLRLPRHRFPLNVWWIGGGHYDGIVVRIMKKILRKYLEKRCMKQADILPCFVMVIEPRKFWLRLILRS